jgi:hypothetical protein
VAEPVPVYHTHGPQACGGVAFLYAGPRPVTDGALVESRHVRFPDARFPNGRPARHSEPAACAACGWLLSEQAVTHMMHAAGIYVPDWQAPDRG